MLGAVVCGALAAWLVPWDAPPGGAPAPVDPETVLTGPEIARAEAYGAYARVVSWTSTGVSLLIALWLGLGRRGAALVRRIPGPWWAQVVGGVVALAFIGRFLTLPFALALWRRRLSEGISTQGWGAWFADLLLGTLVTAVGMAILALMILGCARRWQRWWPAIAGGIAAAFVVLGSFAYPLVVEPLFNDFVPLQDAGLRSEIQALGEAEGVDVGEVLVADASRSTTTLNAYVSGFGSTHRVVLYDNALADLPEDQLLSIVAHELAHAGHHDVLIGTAIGAAGAFAGVGLLGLLLPSGLLRRRSDAEGAGDPAVVPLLVALIALGTFLALPAQNAISRQIEWRADAVALATTDDPGAFVQLQRELAVHSLADPTPSSFGQFWFGSHPTTLQRIALAEKFAAEQTAEQAAEQAAEQD